MAFGGLGGDALGLERAGGNQGASGGPGAPGLGETGGPGRGVAGIIGVDERDGRRLGMDGRDGSGGLIGGRMRADGAFDDEYAEGGGRRRRGHEGRDGNENEPAGFHGFGRSGHEEGSMDRSGRGSKSYSHSGREAIGSGRPRGSVSGTDNADGSEGLRRRRNGVDDSGLEDGQIRKGYRGGQDGLDGSEYDEFGNKIRGKKSGHGGRGKRAEDKAEFDLDSSRDGIGRERHRGRKRHGSDDEYSKSSSSRDGSGRHGRRKHGHRRHRDSEGSTSSIGENGRHRRRHRGSSESSYDVSDSRSGSRRRRRGHKEPLGSEDADASRGARKRQRKESQGSETKTDGRLGRAAAHRDSEDSETLEERKRKRYRKIEEPLKDRYHIPQVETAGDLPNEILKHFAYVDAEDERRKWLEIYNGLLIDVPPMSNLKVSPKQFLPILTHRMAHFMEYAANKRRSALN